ncbi:MAG: F0F1 ATP synthase subunit B [Pararoseburia sp.]|nr:F0F1 ATP synthase subunit B [Lachnospiraceae bacterium]MDY4794043.1 F0F1 ATP synthase subunit B [Pararoseburia sp.]
MTRLFNLDFQLLFDSGLLAISVFVLFLLMSKLLFNPARKLLTDRQNKIREDLASAAGDKEDAEKLRIEYEEKLKNAEKETEAILSEARQKALKNEAKIIADAKEEAAAIIARANEEAALEKKRVADEMKQEMISVAAMMAGKVVAANINTEIQADLVDDTLKEMGEATWQN